MRHLGRGAAAALFVVMPAVAQAAEKAPAAPSDALSGRQQLIHAGYEDQDLTRLSLEELSMVEVTSVSRQPHPEPHRTRPDPARLPGRGGLPVRDGDGL